MIYKLHLLQLSKIKTFHRTCYYKRKYIKVAWFDAALINAWLPQNQEYLKMSISEKSQRQPGHSKKEM